MVLRLILRRTPCEPLSRSAIRSADVDIRREGAAPGPCWVLQLTVPRSDIHPRTVGDVTETETDNARHLAALPPAGSADRPNVPAESSAFSADEVLGDRFPGEP